MRSSVSTRHNHRTQTAEKIDGAGPPFFKHTPYAHRYKMSITSYTQHITTEEHMKVVKQTKMAWSNKGLSQTHFVLDGDTVITIVCDKLHSSDLASTMNHYDQKKRLDTLKERLQKKLQQKHK